MNRSEKLALWIGMPLVAFFVIAISMGASSNATANKPQHAVLSAHTSPAPTASKSVTPTPSATASKTPTPIPSPLPVVTPKPTPKPAPVQAKSTPAPLPAPTVAAPQSCTPLSNEGTCYKPGEYCRTSDHGVTGIAGDGASIICEYNNGWRWEAN